jgi:hypothetical protein
LVEGISSSQAKHPCIDEDHGHGIEIRHLKKAAENAQGKGVV